MWVGTNAESLGYGHTPNTLFLLADIAGLQCLIGAIVSLMARQSTKSLMSTAAVAQISKCQPTSQKVKGHRCESHHLRGFLFLSS